jgi:hypothetical protein
LIALTGFAVAAFTEWKLTESMVTIKAINPEIAKVAQPRLM